MLLDDQDKIQLDLTAYQGKDLKADLLCRDFAFNALAYPVSALPEIIIEKQKEGNAKILLKRLRKNQMVDYAGGLEDVSKKMIDITSTRVFENDPLRMLRAFRSSAELGFTISPRTLKLIKKQAALISRSAGERVREELERLDVHASYLCG